MERVDVDDVEPGAAGGDAARRGLSDPLDTSAVEINHYRLEPGDRSSGLHAHLDQEEVFLVIEGAATFETLAGEVTVGREGAIRFAPGEFHSGANAVDGAVEVYALGVPSDSQDVRIPLPCPECGRDDRRPGLAADGETPVLVCPDCGAETDATCPACGSVEMRAVLADDGVTPVAVCMDCGAEAAT